MSTPKAVNPLGRGGMRGSNFQNVYQFCLFTSKGADLNDFHWLSETFSPRKGRDAPQARRVPWGESLPLGRANPDINVKGQEALF